MNKFFTITIIVLLFVFTLGVTLADPNGANTVTQEGTSSRGTANSPQDAQALAGNITEITVSGDSITQSWQGYFGNVSGAITLEDASNNTMYNWSLASPQGEIFASTDGSVSWTGVKCFNWTENGTDLETTYNIDGAEDGINETFSDSETHDGFSVGTVSFVADQCMSTQVFDATGAGVASTFDEVLLSDAGGNPIFTALLEQDTLGFDDKHHDFQMLVLEDGHDGDTSETQYFFYVELE